MVRGRLTLLLSAVALAAAVSIASAGCDVGDPQTIGDSELPAALAEALKGLEAAGYDVQVVEAGQPSAPTLVIDGDDPVVVMLAGNGSITAFPNTLSALSDVSDESVDGATEWICGDFIVASAAAGGLRAVARAAAGGCSSGG